VGGKPGKRTVQAEKVGIIDEPDYFFDDEEFDASSRH
jgi:hypothetical protein